ncbi:MAG TPA: TIGR00730 family Rossman fold protein [Leptospiraceae bacterium]|nr:TIGR00730 family Rossman fold protein [Spirochaetaceae bacterium]HBS06522.1 TIGR00730 family Rossman fold protein [Leptospiraceae bacterium]
MSELKNIKSICIFCGSSHGVDPLFAQKAGELARLLAGNGVRIVYGGGSVGLMGIVASEAMSAGGEVIGVIPESLAARELAQEQITELRVVQSMHERKAMMAELSQGFIVLPGGIGTMEEFFEVFTWLQLGIHDKPVALYNTGEYYDGLKRFLLQMVKQQFLKRETYQELIIETVPENLLTRLEEKASKSSDFLKKDLS